MSPRFLFIHSERENIGIEYLCAALKANQVEVDLLYFPESYQILTSQWIYRQDSHDKKNEIFQKIKDYHPDIVCFSPFTSQYSWSVHQAKLIKNRFPKIFILFGGVHVNSVPNDVFSNKYIDGLIVGEADHLIVDFARRFYRKNLISLPSLWIKRDGQVYINPIAKLEANLDLLPLPDKEIFLKNFPKAIRGDYVIMGSRGCPFHCSYCGNDSFEKLYHGQKRLRYRSPSSIIQELKYAKKHFSIKRVHFMDDILTLDEKRLQVLMRLYRRHVRLPFICYLHPKTTTEKTIKLLAKSGCNWLQVGVQSANEKFRARVLGRFETNREIVDFSFWCRKHKLIFSIDHIFNLPGETESELVEAVNLYNTCRPSFVNFGNLCYLPNTGIIEFGLKNKVLTKRDVKSINHGQAPVFRPANPDVNYSVFEFLFMSISVFPRPLISLLLKMKIYRSRWPVPGLITLVLKILIKIRSRQLYIYFFVVRSFIFHFLSDLKRLLIHRIDTLAVGL